MAKIRVLRIMEYIYDDVETMESDMVRWHVQGGFQPRHKLTIKSTTLSPEILKDEDD